MTISNTRLSAGVFMWPAKTAGVCQLQTNKKSAIRPGSQAMLFFDPVLRGVFGGDVAEAQWLLADDTGIERLIERLEELDEDARWDA